MTLLPSQLFPNAYLSSGKGNIYLLHIVRADSILLKSCFYYRLGVVVCLFFSLPMLISMRYRVSHFFLN